jgi:hypothetical protein
MSGNEIIVLLIVFALFMVFIFKAGQWYGMSRKDKK